MRDVHPTRPRRIARGRVSSWIWLGLLNLLLSVALSGRGGAATLRSDVRFNPNPTQWSRLTRTLSLLRESTPEARKTVKLLFYGQSITHQDWSRQLSDFLRTNFPHANLVITNRAISGLEAAYLKRTALADIAGWQPDLVILHCYGSEFDTDQLLHEIRSRTTSDILLQTDHIWLAGEVDEPTDPATIQPGTYFAYRNYVWLPRLADRYDACLAEVRDHWRAYLKRHGLTARSLIDKGGSHLNEEANVLLSTLLSCYFRLTNAPSTPPAFDQPRVRAAEIGTDLNWNAGELLVDFRGHRIEVEADGKPAAPIDVWIDDRKPSSYPELYSFTRTTDAYGAPWPAILRITSASLPLLEEWSVAILSMSADGRYATYQIRGSLTGFDGETREGRDFTSTSGRVVINPADWMTGLAVYYSELIPPESYRIKWRVLANFADQFNPMFASDPTTMTVVDLACGLANAPHRLRLRSRDGVGGGVKSIRVYDASGEASLTSLNSALPARTDRFEIRKIGLEVWAIWPASWGDARLETTESLSAPQWQNVTGNVAVLGQIRALRQMSGEDEAYFRLVPETFLPDLD